MKLLAQGQRMADFSTWAPRGGTPAEVQRSRISLTGLPTEDATRICRVGSGSVSQNVQAHGREVISLAGVERPSRFVHSLPNRVLRFRGKGPQDSRG
jgi:hypothetical protein